LFLADVVLGPALVLRSVLDLLTSGSVLARLALVALLAALAALVALALALALTLPLALAAAFALALALTFALAAFAVALAVAFAFFALAFTFAGALGVLSGGVVAFATHGLGEVFRLAADFVLVLTEIALVHPPGFGLGTDGLLLTDDPVELLDQVLDALA